jgi:hypothetical protein
MPGFTRSAMNFILRLSGRKSFISTKNRLRSRAKRLKASEGYGEEYSAYAHYFIE